MVVFPDLGTKLLKPWFVHNSVFAIANKPIGARLDINIVFKGNK